MSSALCSSRRRGREPSRLPGALGRRRRAARRTSRYRRRARSSARPRRSRLSRPSCRSTRRGDVTHELTRARGRSGEHRWVRTVNRCTSSWQRSSSTTTTAPFSFFVDALGFELVENTPANTNDGRPKRWVVVRPPGAQTGLLLARADGDRQAGAVGGQYAGRVGLFLRVEDFDLARERMLQHGVRFLTVPRDEPYGRVAVFVDVAGNSWDLLGPRPRTVDESAGACPIVRGAPARSSCQH